MAKKIPAHVKLAQKIMADIAKLPATVDGNVDEVMDSIRKIKAYASHIGRTISGIEKTSVPSEKLVRFYGRKSALPENFVDPST